MSRKQYAHLIYQRKYRELGELPESPEFIVRVDKSEFERWMKNKSAVPLVQVVDTLEVFIAKSGRGHTGQLMRPTNDQLLDAFGSLKFEDIFDFMAVNGHLHQSHKRGDLEGHEKGAYTKSDRQDILESRSIHRY